MSASLAPAIDQLHHALDQLREGEISVHAFCEMACTQTALMAALPERYASVWQGLLDRLESSALFSEESCSFSQSELLDSLSLWLDKAQRLLEA
jgi:hypothetical protein